MVALNTLRKRACLPSLVLWIFTFAGSLAEAIPAYNSPLSLCADTSKNTLYIAEHTGPSIAVFSIDSGTVTQRIPLVAPPTGQALTKGGDLLYVATGSPEGHVEVIDTQRFEVIDRIEVGHTAQDLVLSPDNSTLYACNRFDNNISVIDTDSKRTLATIRCYENRSPAR